MSIDTLTTRRKAALATPHRLSAEATRDISAALTTVLADMFALYFKTKNSTARFGPAFPLPSPLLETTRPVRSSPRPMRVAERARKIGGHVAALAGACGKAVAGSRQ